MSSVEYMKVGGKQVSFEHTAVNDDRHMFIDGMHDPKLCPECIKPGSLSTHQEPEWEVRMVNTEEWLGVMTILHTANTPRTRAIAEAIEALMTYVYGEFKATVDFTAYEIEQRTWNKVSDAIEEARTLIGKQMKGLSK